MRRNKRKKEKLKFKKILKYHQTNQKEGWMPLNVSLPNISFHVALSTAQLQNEEKL